MKSVVFTYGRFNPPHLGHKMMIQEIVNKAKKLNKTPVVVVSHRIDKNNPLSPQEKILILREWFPNVEFTESSKNRGIIKIAEDFSENSIMIIGENRKNSFSNKFLPFKKVAIDRPNSAPSATKARNAAFNNNVELFENLTGYKLTQKLVNRVRKLREEAESKKYKKIVRTPKLKTPINKK